MFDQYKDACAQLTLGQEKLEEMISMTENKPKKRLSHPIKTALIAAACLAALSITAFAASPAGQEAIRSIFITVRTFPTVQSYTEDGHTYLVVDDETIDVTQELEENGSYSLELEDGGHISVTSDGWVSMDSGNGNVSYSFRATDGPVDITPRAGLVTVITNEDGSVHAEADTPGVVSGSYNLELEDGGRLDDWATAQSGSGDVSISIQSADGSISNVSVTPKIGQYTIIPGEDGTVSVEADTPGSVDVFDFVALDANDPDSVAVYDYVVPEVNGSDGVVINYVSAE